MNNNNFTKVELDDWLDFIKDTVLELEICISNLEKIVDAQKDNNERIDTIIGFLGHYANLCFGFCSTELVKLFVLNKKTEKRSFHELFNRLKSYAYDDHLKNLLKENKETKEKIFSRIVRVVLKKIRCSSM